MSIGTSPGERSGRLARREHQRLPPAWVRGAFGVGCRRDVGESISFDLSGSPQCPSHEPRITLITYTSFLVQLMTGLYVRILNGTEGLSSVDHPAPVLFATVYKQV